MTNGKTKRNPKFEWQSAFIESGITANPGFIGLLMSTLDNGDGRHFFISAKRISTMTGLTERAVRDSIKKLRDAGWIVQVERGGNRGGRAMASTYRLARPEGPGAASTAQPAQKPTQGEAASTQAEACFTPVDQVPLDQVPLDQHPLDQVSDAVRNRTGTGAEVKPNELRRDEWEKLLPTAQRDYYPSFEKDDVMVLHTSPLPNETPDLPPVPPSRPSSQAIDTRPEWRQRQDFERTLRDEGLDPYGDPLPR